MTVKTYGCPSSSHTGVPDYDITFAPRLFWNCVSSSRCSRLGRQDMPSHSAPEHVRVPHSCRCQLYAPQGWLQSALHSVSLCVCARDRSYFAFDIGTRRSLILATQPVPNLQRPDTYHHIRAEAVRTANPAMYVSDLRTVGVDCELRMCNCYIRFAPSARVAKQLRRCLSEHSSVSGMGLLD